MHSDQAVLYFDTTISQAIWGAGENGAQNHVIPVAAGLTIRQALDTRGIRLPRAAIALVRPQGASDSLTCDLDHVLQPGDSVRFLFQISGGSI